MPSYGSDGCVEPLRGGGGRGGVGRRWVAWGVCSATRYGVLRRVGRAGMRVCVCVCVRVFNRIVKCAEDNTVLSSREGKYICVKYCSQMYNNIVIITTTKPISCVILYIMCV